MVKILKFQDILNLLEIFSIPYGVIYEIKDKISNHIKSLFKKIKDKKNKSFSIIFICVITFYFLEICYL